MTLLLTFKALHLFFIIAWFAGIFYLPRLFVYHAETQSQDCDSTFKVMERRLLYFITPFAVLTVISGLVLIMAYGSDWFVASKWLHYKLLLVVLLLGYHGWCFTLLADFKHNRNTRSARFYRVINELPVLVLLAIIVLAVFKPS